MNQIQRQYYSLEAGSERENSYKYGSDLPDEPKAYSYLMMGTRTLGDKVYELKAHLGNVRVTLSDVRLSTIFNSALTSFRTEVVSMSDYYAFGMLMVGRNWSAGEYRYGFNGQERTDEISGIGNHNTAEFWEYDTRLGRRWNIDPVFKEYEGSYTAYSCNPIWFTDILGADTVTFSKYSYSQSDRCGGCAKNTGERYSVSVNLGGTDVFYYEQTHVEYDAAGKEISRKYSKTQFDPIANTLSGATTTESPFLIDFKDRDRVSLAKLAPPDLLDYLFQRASNSDVQRLAYFDAKAIQSTVKNYGKLKFIQEIAVTEAGFTLVWELGATALAEQLAMRGAEETITLYRNFGWDEYIAIRDAGGVFSIHPNQFQGKQFWVGEEGLNMWLSRKKFADHFTAKITIPKSYATPGHKNYIFMEKNMKIDTHPGGTVLPENLEKFNSIMKIEWIRY